MGVRQQRPLPPALNRLSSVSGSGMSLAPLRRKTSMGSFQKGMGESLKGRMRKQMDIPVEPKKEIDLNIPIDQITSLKYLAQVGGKRNVTRPRVPGPERNWTVEMTAVVKI